MATSAWTRARSLAMTRAIVSRSASRVRTLAFSWESACSRSAIRCLVAASAQRASQPLSQRNMGYLAYRLSVIVRVHDAAGPGPEELQLLRLAPVDERPDPGRFHGQQVADRGRRRNAIVPPANTGPFNRQLN